MKLFLIRHGRISVTMDVCYGQTDYPPIDTLNEEAKRLRSCIDFSGVNVVTSPLQRCIKLVEQIGIKEYSVEPKLKEIDCGDWEGTQWKDLEKESYSNWKKNMLTEPFPNGESYTDLYERIGEFINSIVEEHRDGHESFTLFTHGGVIRAAIANLLNLGLKDSFKIFMDYGRYAEFEISEKKLRCLGFNL